jgi:hypothetical protein
VELKPLRHVENDACEQARCPLVQLKRSADVRWEGPGTSAAGPSSHRAEQDRGDSNIRASVDRSLIAGGPDDHPARPFLRFLTDRGERPAMEVIGGNRLKPGDYKYIGSFPHFVADAGEDRVGKWLDEKIDLASVYAEVWKEAAPAHLIDIAVFLRQR